MICENVVSWPWPCALVPTRAVTVPSSSISTEPYSWVNVSGALISRYDATPMPSSLRVAALAARLLLGAQRVVAGVLERGVERLVVLAAVVVAPRPVFGVNGNASGGMKFLRRISTGIDAELVGRDVEDALHEVDRLGPAGAAVRGDRRGVRDRGLPVELDLRDHVHVLRHHLREERQERADRRVRARVGDACARAGR